MRQLKDLGLIIAYELHGFRLYIKERNADLSERNADYILPLLVLELYTPHRNDKRGG